jgi:hypothetical protein
MASSINARPIAIGIAGHVRKGGAAFLLALLILAEGVQAQPGAATLSYPASDFAGAQLNTAYDMVTRLPGFVFDNGNSARGFAGTAGNVLIDGARSSAKADDLQAVLKRIPVASVDRIDVIRGGAPGIDMQGQAVVANVILKGADSTTTILTLSNILYADRADVPGGSIEFSRKSGERSFDVTLSRYDEINDDAAGDGAYVFSTLGGPTDTGSVRRRGGLQTGWGLNASTSLPLWGGKFGANFTGQQKSNSETLAYGAPDTALFFSGYKFAPNELGLNWTGAFGADEITVLALGRLERDQTLNTETDAGGLQIFRGVQDVGESIVRGTWRYHWTEALTLESGGEGVYNTLNGRTSFVANGVAVAIPAANARVGERRGEIFAQATWKFADGSVEAGSRLEASRLSALGLPSRSLAFVKPRILASWSPWSDTQLRLRVERVVGQLDFSNFVASSDLSGVGISAGNLNLRPDQRWQIEGDSEFHFWGSAALVASVMHEDITDLVDYIPIGNGLDGPGNVHKAANDEFKIDLSLPFDRLGIRNGVFKADLKWDDGAVKDPVTGQTRPISGQRDHNLNFEYTQDVADWNSTFDLQANSAGWARPSYRINQVATTRLTSPFAQATWDYKPAPDLDIGTEVDFFIPYRLDIELDNYAGPRNAAALTQIQHIRNTAEPHFLLQLRKTF